MVKINKVYLAFYLSNMERSCLRILLKSIKSVSLCDLEYITIDWGMRRGI